MIKILIVEDEQIERKALKQIILNGIRNVEVIWEAKTGEEAVEKAIHLQPDLIFMDIKIPGIDGLEAIKEIKQQNPKAEFIIVSAYDLFEYARKGLHLGVQDFILKPSTAETITSTTIDVIDKINKKKEAQAKRENEQNLLEKLLPFAEADIVNQLIFDQVQEVHLKEIFNLLQIKNYDRGFILTLSIQAKHSHSAKREKQQLLMFVQNWLHKNAQSLVGSFMSGHIPVIIFLNEPTSYRQKAMSIARKLLNVLHEFNAELHYFIGIGGEYSLKDVGHSYLEATLVINSFNLSKRYCFYDQLLETDQEYTTATNYKFELEKNILDEIHAGNIANVQRTIPAYIQQLKQSGVSLKEARVRINSVLFVLSRTISGNGMDIDQNVVTVQAHDYTQLAEESTVLFKKIIMPYEKLMDQSQPVLQQIKQYIEKHAHNQLTLEMIATHVNLSPYYVSKLFKEHGGVNFIDYLTNCRIKKAKKLILSTNKSIKEIAYEVGYNEPNYFSRVFKKTCGISPRMYREDSENKILYEKTK